MSSAEVRNDILLGCLVAVPYLLRSLVEYLLSHSAESCTQACCGKTESPVRLLKENDDDDLTNIDQPPLYEIISNEGDDFYLKFGGDQVVGRPRWSLIVLASLRLSFWHLMQPALYFVILYAYWPLLNAVQQVFGSLVAIREGYYALICIFGAIHKPIYLVPDIDESFNETELISLLFYVLYPEKYLTVVVLEQANGCLIFLIILMLLILDFCSFGAAITALMAPRIYPPLMIGYCITSVGYLAMTVMFVERAVAHMDFRDRRNT